MALWCLNPLRTPREAAGVAYDSKLYGLAITAREWDRCHTASIIDGCEPSDVTLECAALARAMLALAVEDIDQMLARFETVYIVSSQAFTAPPLSNRSNVLADCDALVLDVLIAVH